MNNIIGEYTIKIPLTTMFLNTTINIKHHNIITTLGELFFMNRCVNDNYNPIENIVIGNGTNPPQKSDKKLGNETKRSDTVRTEVDKENHRIILTTQFTSTDIIGATEIGVTTKNQENEEILISHDVFDETSITDSLLTGVIGLIDIEYTYTFSTSQIKTGWKNIIRDGNPTDIYYVYEPNMVLTVYNNTYNDGLRQCNNEEELNTKEDSYYYDLKTNNLMIRLHDKISPLNCEIIIQSK